MKIALCQMKIVDDKKANIKKAYEMIKEASIQGARLVVLPEMFNCPYSSKYFREYSEKRGTGTYNELSKWALEFGITIVGGSIPEIENDNIYNTSYTFGPEGQCLGAHRKVHLFDIDIPGGIRFMESETLSAGDSYTMIDAPFGRFGVAICYDMRFPEFFRAMALDGAKFVIVPAAFNMTTGPAHWALTARARALDNQLFVALCSPARDEHSDYVAYGYSMVTNPWGEIIGNLEQEEGILVVDMELEQCEEIRKGLPLLKHRRPEIY